MCDCHVYKCVCVANVDERKPGKKSVESTQLQYLPTNNILIQSINHTKGIKKRRWQSGQRKRKRRRKKNKNKIHEQHKHTQLSKLHDIMSSTTYVVLNLNDWLYLCEDVSRIKTRFYHTFCTQFSSYILMHGSTNKVSHTRTNVHARTRLI